MSRYFPCHGLISLHDIDFINFHSVWVLDEIVFFEKFEDEISNVNACIEANTRSLALLLSKW